MVAPRKDFKVLKNNNCKDLPGQMSNFSIELSSQKVYLSTVSSSSIVTQILLTISSHYS